ncbi:MAG: hypothetical protein ACOZQL_12760 [Myxococcota bacterium]
MNHFISGILKIVLLEGSIALLLIDAIAGERFTKARARAHGVLAGLMVFAWANYGSLRWNTHYPTVLTSIPVILACGWLIGFAFAKDRDARVAAIRQWGAADPSRAATVATWVGVIVAATLGVWLGWLPGRAGSDPGAFFQDATGWLLVSAAGVFFLQRYVKRLARGEAKAPAMLPSLVKQARPLAVALVVLLSGGWVAGGVAAGKLPLIHQWEQFHFLIGAKYQREIGWFNLYKAAILADRETTHALANLQLTRDLTTFDEVKVDVALQDAAAVRARFSDARWEEFKADWAAMSKLWQIDWSRIMADHGNSNSPAWAILAAPIAKLVPISARGQAFLGWLDMLLMLGLWLAVWQTFGHRVASVGLFIWATPPLVFDYLSGSFLRWDWLFAMGLAVCLLHQKRYAGAGGFFGYAIATKLFPIWFGVALAIRAAFEWRRTKQFSADYVKFLKGTVIAGALSVALSAAMFGPGAWKEYAERIQVAQVEKFYAIQYSLKTVYLQHAASPVQDWGNTIFPGDLRQRMNDVNADDYRFGFLLARIAFTLLIAVMIRRATDVEAFTLGPLLVFTWLTVNMYYWNMLGLMALGLALRSERPNQRPALGLLIGTHVIFMVFYLYQHLNRGLTEGYAVAWLLSALIIGTAVWERRTATAESQSA